MNAEKEKAVKEVTDKITKEKETEIKTIKAENSKKMAELK
jgi:uncharacterized protein (DUF2164 family)